MPREKIIVVDDSQDILEGLKLFLELKMYQVRTCNSEQELYKLISEFNPSIIILDIFIAGQDCRHICHNLKKDPQTAHLKVVLTSAAPHALNDYRKFGADDILEKPFGLEEIYSKIESLL